MEKENGHLKALISRDVYHVLSLSGRGEIIPSLLVRVVVFPFIRANERFRQL
jgi:hypothetical protein